MRHIRRAAVIVALLIPLLTGGFFLQSRVVRDSASRFDQVRMLVAGRFVDSLTEAALYERAARGLVAQLDDPYAALYSPEELRAFTQETYGRYAGVGMVVEDQEGSAIVTRVYPRTPAEGAGIIEGDSIVAVEGRETRGWELRKVTDALKGEPGSAVAITIGRPYSGQRMNRRLTRSEIHIPAVPYAMMLDGQIGYVPLVRFNETSADETRQAARRLIARGAKGLVIDLRGNGGGIVDQAVAIAGYFLRPGQEVMSVRGRAGQSRSYLSREKPISTSLPLVVLVDGGSASASEIVAGALQDHDRALIVGTTSFGKGLEQGVFALQGGWALKMTTAKWYAPSGRSIHKDRRTVNGRLAELPDSMETDSVKRGRPVFRSDAGRVVYGGGAVTPDLIVNPDTLSAREQELSRALSVQAQRSYLAVSRYAWELKPRVRGDFTVQPDWRRELYRRLRAGGVSVDSALYFAETRYVDRLLEARLSRVTFGDSAVKQRTLGDDAQLVRALDMLRASSSQQELFARVERARAGLSSM
jgi:carboxyl-terminal processing protease